MNRLEGLIKKLEAIKKGLLAQSNNDYQDIDIINGDIEKLIVILSGYITGPLDVFYDKNFRLDYNIEHVLMRHTEEFIKTVEERLKIQKIKGKNIENIVEKMRGAVLLFGEIKNILKHAVSRETSYEDLKNNNDSI